MKRSLPLALAAALAACGPRPAAVSARAALGSLGEPLGSLEIDKFQLCVDGPGMSRLCGREESFGGFDQGATLQNVPAGAGRVLHFQGWASNDPGHMRWCGKSDAFDLKAGSTHQASFVVSRCRGFVKLDAAAQLRLPRAFATCTLLSDGLVLVAGGYDTAAVDSTTGDLVLSVSPGTGPIPPNASAELYDYRTGKFGPLPSTARYPLPLTSGRGLHGAAAWLPTGGPPSVTIVGGSPRARLRVDGTTAVPIRMADPGISGAEQLDEKGGHSLSGDSGLDYNGSTRGLFGSAIAAGGDWWVVAGADGPTGPITDPATPLYRVSRASSTLFASPQNPPTGFPRFGQDTFFYAGAGVGELVTVGGVTDATRNYEVYAINGQVSWPPGLDAPASASYFPVPVYFGASALLGDTLVTAGGVTGLDGIADETGLTSAAYVPRAIVRLASLKGAAAVKQGAPLKRARAAATAFPVDDHELVFFGGLSTDPTSTVTGLDATAEIYDVAKAAPSTTADLAPVAAYARPQLPRLGACTVPLPDGTLLVAGGVSSASTVEASVEIYNPTSTVQLK